MRPHPGSPAPRRFVPIVFTLLATLAVLPAYAAWQPGGTLLVPFTSQGYKDWGSIAPNGSGGAFVTWTNSFSYPLPSDRTDYTLGAQQVDVNGNVPAPWPVSGVVVRTWRTEPGWTGADVTPMPLLMDGSGGAIAPETAFETIVEPVTRFHLYRIASDGTVTGVPEYSGPFAGPAVTAAQVDVDGAGGVVMMAIQQTFGIPGNPPGPGDLYARRVDPLGNELWYSEFCNSGILGGGWDVLADGAGGGFFAWCEKAAGGAVELFVQHLDGTSAIVPGWPADGRLVRGGAGAMGRVMLASDGAGGAIVLWRDERNSQPHLFAHHVFADGSVDPAIPANGRALASSSLNDELTNLVSDGQAGAYVTRFSHDNFTNQQVRLYHLDPALMPHTGWPAEGRLMPGGCVLAPDGSGGTFIAFYFGPYPPALVAQHLTSDGSPAPGWTESGYELATGVASFGIVRSDAGAIVAWIEGRPDAPGIYAQRLVPDGPVAVQLSLVGATAEPGNVSLHWYATGAAMLAATVERRADDTDWNALGTVSADGAGHLRYEDGSMGAGRFGYRVTWTEDGTARHAGEVWVDVPDAWRLALSAPRPNPGSGPASFAVTLADRAPASIELLDLQGRRVAHRDLGAFDAGSHVVRFEEAAALAPGVYLARLTQGVETRTVRVIRIR